MEAAASYELELNNLKATELRLGLPGTENESRGTKRSLEETKSSEPAQTQAKAQVVGWPPVRSYRKNNLHAKKTETEANGTFVKVSMDGAPYLRKIDLKMYEGYKELRQALESMFKCFSEIEGCNRSDDYAITYEDKDGDLMLVGDVPWGMFTSSCKRLRIMRGSEARGLGSNQ